MFFFAAFAIFCSNILNTKVAKSAKRGEVPDETAAT
jgi:hypothetical protein